MSQGLGIGRYRDARQGLDLLLDVLHPFELVGVLLLEASELRLGRRELLEHPVQIPGVPGRGDGAEGIDGGLARDQPAQRRLDGLAVGADVFQVDSLGEVPAVRGVLSDRNTGCHGDVFPRLGHGRHFERLERLLGIPELGFLLTQLILQHVGELAQLDLLQIGGNRHELTLEDVDGLGDQLRVGAGERHDQEAAGFRVQIRPQTVPEVERRITKGQDPKPDLEVLGQFLRSGPPQEAGRLAHRVGNRAAGELDPAPEQQRVALSLSIDFQSILTRLIPAGQLKSVEEACRMLAHWLQIQFHFLHHRIEHGEGPGKLDPVVRRDDFRGLDGPVAQLPGILEVERGGHDVGRLDEARRQHAQGASHDGDQSNQPGKAPKGGEDSGELSGTRLRFVRVERVNRSLDRRGRDRMGTLLIGNQGTCHAVVSVQLRYRNLVISRHLCMSLHGLDDAADMHLDEDIPLR